MVALGKDAIFLNKALKLKVTCMKKGLCKAGIPVSHTFKYTDLMDAMGYTEGDTYQMYLVINGKINES